MRCLRATILACLLPWAQAGLLRHRGESRQAKLSSDAASQDEDKPHADAVREALRHMWEGYKAGAWGQDEVKPISGASGGHFGDMGMEILDSMDTLWLAGLKKEFKEGEEWISKLDLEGHNGYTTSFFEVTIRGLGGLLSAYALSGDKVLLDKARMLGNKLVTAFPGKGPGDAHAWPRQTLDMRDPTSFDAYPEWAPGNIVADAGSNILEFTYLSEASKDPSYQAAADENENQLVSLAKRRKRHLLGQYLDPADHEDVESKLTVGAMADSYYEYLLKAYLQSGKRETRLLHEWKKAMNQMRRDLVRVSPGGLTYLANGKGSTEMEHLSCFMGGLLALGANLVPKEEVEDWWMPTGEAITHTCYEMYRQSPSGLAGDSTNMGEELTPGNAQYILRPETLESLFYMHRFTGNSTYRDWSNEIFNSINKKTRTKYGFAVANDVTQENPPLDDSEQTFLGAETFKYALLINLPASALPLDQYVFNTEAHPMPVVSAQSEILKHKAKP